MSRKLKDLIVSELSTRYKGMDHCLVVDFKGLSAEAATRLRRELKGQGIKLEVTKNSLASLAFRDVGATQLAQLLKGMCALVSGGDDAIALAKAVAKWIKDNSVLEVKGGYLAGQVLSPSDVQKLAQIPPRPVLYGQILGGIAAPMYGVANAFSSVMRSMACALQAIADQKAKAQAA